jgi:hypothetical protein
MKSRFLLVACFGLLLSNQADEKRFAQSTRAVYPVSILWPSRVAYPKTPQRPGFVIDISQAPNENKPWPEDYLVMDILPSGRSMEALASMKFHSSYGYFDLSLVDVTGDGIEEFFLVSGEGRGTNARSETLTVWQRDGRAFKSILSVPVSGPCGVSCVWEYERHFEDINGDGIPDLRLIRKTAGSVQEEDRKLIPQDTEKDYVWSATQGRMIPVK